MFGSLPPELVVQILEKIDIGDLLNFGLTSKQNYNYSQDNILWLKKIRKTYPKLVFNYDLNYKIVYFKKRFTVLYVINPNPVVINYNFDKLKNFNSLLISTTVSSNRNRVKKDVRNVLIKKKKPCLLDRPFYLRQSEFHKLLKTGSFQYFYGDFEPVDFNQLKITRYAEYVLYGEYIKRETQNVYVVVIYNIPDVLPSFSTFESYLPVSSDIEKEGNTYLNFIKFFESEKRFDEFVRDGNIQGVPSQTNELWENSFNETSYCHLTKRILNDIQREGIFSTIYCHRFNMFPYNYFICTKVPVQNKLYV